MLRNKKLFVWIILILILLICTMSKFYILNHREESEPVKISRIEQEAMDSFYKDDYGNISKGKIFDIKYAYYDPVNIEDNTIEIIKKKHIKVEIDYIEILKQNGKEHLYGQFDFTNTYDLSSSFPRIFISMDNEKKFRLYGKTVFSLLNVSATCDTKLKNIEPARYDWFNDITLVLRVNGIEEKHHLVFNEDKQFELAKDYKESLFTEKNRSIYAYVQTNYYFGFLFKKDFNQWYKEVKSYLLMDINRDNVDGYLITHFTFNVDSKSELKKFLQLNDQQFNKYLEILRAMNNKGIINQLPKYLAD